MPHPDPLTLITGHLWGREGVVSSDKIEEALHAKRLSHWSGFRAASTAFALWSHCCCVVTSPCLNRFWRIAGGLTGKLNTLNEEEEEEEEEQDVRSATDKLSAAFGSGFGGGNDHEPQP